MNTVILDPTDPTKAVIGHHASSPWGAVEEGGAVLANIHSAMACQGRPCTIHNPTDHGMREWPLLWRNDRGIFERICPHGVGHPDPDQEDYWRETGQEWQAVHGCDVCCL